MTHLSSSSFEVFLSKPPIEMHHPLVPGDVTDDGSLIYEVKRLNSFVMLDRLPQRRIELFVALHAGLEITFVFCCPHGEQLEWTVDSRPLALGRLFCTRCQTPALFIPSGQRFCHACGAELPTP